MKTLMARTMLLVVHLITNRCTCVDTGMLYVGRERNALMLYHEINTIIGSTRSVKGINALKHRFNALLTKKIKQIRL